MRKIQWFPRQRVTLHEMKWLQEQHSVSLKEIVKRTNAHGVYNGIIADEEFSVVKGAGNFDLTMQAQASGIHSYVNEYGYWYATFPDEAEFTGQYSFSFSWLDRIIGVPATGTSGWVNIFIVPDYTDISDLSVVNLYREAVHINTSNHQVIDGDGNIITPYLEGYISDSNITNWIRTTKTAEPEGALELTNTHEINELFDIDGFTPIQDSGDKFAVHIASIHYDPAGPVYTSGGNYRIWYQPLVPARAFSYTGQWEEVLTGVSAATIQGTMDNLQEVFLDYYQALVSGVEEAFITPYDNAVFITTGTSPGSAFSQNTAFPSGTGERYDY